MVEIDPSACPLEVACSLKTADAPICGSLPEHTPALVIASPTTLCLNGLREAATAYTERLTHDQPAKLQAQAKSFVEQALASPHPAEVEELFAQSATTLDKIISEQSTHSPVYYEALLLEAYLPLFKSLALDQEPTQEDREALPVQLGDILAKVRKANLGPYQKENLSIRAATFYLFSRQIPGETLPALDRELGRYHGDKSVTHHGYRLHHGKKVPFRIVGNRPQLPSNPEITTLILKRYHDDPEALYDLIIKEIQGQSLDELEHRQLATTSVQLLRSLEQFETKRDLPIGYLLAERLSDDPRPSKDNRGEQSYKWRIMESGIRKQAPDVVGLSLIEFENLLRTREASLADLDYVNVGIGKAFFASFLKRADGHEASYDDASLAYRESLALLKAVAPDFTTPGNNIAVANFSRIIGLAGFARNAQTQPAEFVYPASPRELTAGKHDGVRYSHHAYQITFGQEKRPITFNHRSVSLTTKGAHPDIVRIYTGDVALQTIKAIRGFEPQGEDVATQTNNAIATIARIMNRDSQRIVISEEEKVLLDTFCQRLSNAVKQKYPEGRHPDPYRTRS